MLINTDMDYREEIKKLKIEKNAINTSSQLNTTDEEDMVCLCPYRCMYVNTDLLHEVSRCATAYCGFEST